MIGTMAEKLDVALDFNGLDSEWLDFVWLEPE
jgi:hypothetical protein